jgi:hypothetical protein
VVVCQPPTEDTSIETPNETSGEVALKTSDPAEREFTPDLTHHFAKHILSQNIKSDFFLKSRSSGGSWLSCVVGLDIIFNSWKSKLD